MVLVKVGIAKAELKCVISPGMSTDEYDLTSNVVVEAIDFRPGQTKHSLTVLDCSCQPIDVSFP